MDIVNNKIFSKVFMWMFIGLAITFGVAYYVSQNENMLYNVFTKSYVVLAIVEIALVLVLSICINKLNPLVAKLMFCLYSFVTGLTLSGIFVVYNLPSIMYVFGITSVLFLIFALVGYYTNIDLRKFGIYLFMALIGIIIASIVNIFIGSAKLDLGITIIGIIIFLGYIAYDIKLISQYSDADNENTAIYLALQLYIDFINLFLRLLKLIARSDD